MPRNQTGGTSPFELLAAIGRDCVGAAQLLPVDQVPDDLFGIHGESLDEQRIAKLLRSTTAPAGGLARAEPNADLRLSIAGAQEKTALLWHNEQWLLPQGSTPTTHILKLPLGLVGDMQADFRTSVENEWLCSQIMELFGLPVARTAILQFEDQKVLAVERFDRKNSDDGTWIARSGALWDSRAQNTVAGCAADQADIHMPPGIHVVPRSADFGRRQHPHTVFIGSQSSAAGNLVRMYGRTTRKSPPCLNRSAPPPWSPPCSRRPPPLSPPPTRPNTAAPRRPPAPTAIS